MSTDISTAEIRAVTEAYLRQITKFGADEGEDQGISAVAFAFALSAYQMGLSKEQVSELTARAIGYLRDGSIVTGCK